MASAVASNPIFTAIHRHRGMVLPFAAIALLMVILIPLPPAVLDFLLILNLTLSAIVLVTTIFVNSPLEFSVFPSLLLGVTLFRLVLNAATTRLILTAGDRFPTPEFAMAGAGHVVMAFSQFVSGNSLAGGVVIFMIILVIQVGVITQRGTTHR